MSDGAIDSARKPFRRWLQGTGPFSGLAVGFLLLGGLFLLIAMWSPSWILWTGHPVPSSERGGIVFYSYRGQNYSLDPPSRFVFHETTVYLEPANPSVAMLNDPVERAIDLVTVGGPVVVAVVLLGFGFRRRRRWARADAAPRDGFGQGIDRETMAWLRDRQRGGA